MIGHNDLALEKTLIIPDSQEPRNSPARKIKRNTHHFLRLFDEDYLLRACLIAPVSVIILRSSHIRFVLVSRLLKIRDQSAAHAREADTRS